MGRVAACADNAAMESFFSLLQKDVLNRKRWETREEVRLAIVTWIERTYHRRWRQEGLGRLTPVEFEMIQRSTTQTATGLARLSPKCQPNCGQTLVSDRQMLSPH